MYIGPSRVGRHELATHDPSGSRCEFAYSSKLRQVILVQGGVASRRVPYRSSHDLVSSLALSEVQQCSRYCRMGFTAPYWYSRHRRGQVLASLVKGLWLGAIAATCRPQQRTKPSIRCVSEDDQDSKGRQPYGGGRVGVGSSFVIFEA